VGSFGIRLPIWGRLMRSLAGSRAIVNFDFTDLELCGAAKNGSLWIRVGLEIRLVIALLKAHRERSTIFVGRPATTGNVRLTATFGCELSQVKPITKGSARYVVGDNI